MMIWSCQRNLKQLYGECASIWISRRQPTIHPSMPQVLDQVGCGSIILNVNTISTIETAWLQLQQMTSNPLTANHRYLLFAINHITLHVLWSIYLPKLYIIAICSTVNVSPCLNPATQWMSQLIQTMCKEENVRLWTYFLSNLRTWRMSILMIATVLES